MISRKLYFLTIISAVSFFPLNASVSSKSSAINLTQIYENLAPKGYTLENKTLTTTATRLKDGGTYEPRLMETIDKEWIKSIVFFKNIKKESGSLNYSLFLC